MTDEGMVTIPLEVYYELRRESEQLRSFQYMKEDLTNYLELKARVEFLQNEFFRMTDQIIELKKKVEK